MATASEHGDTVLSAIIPSRIDLLETALQTLLPEHFPETTQQNLFKLLQKYYERTGSVLTGQALADTFRNNTVQGRDILYTEKYAAYEETKVADHEFIWSSDQLKDIHAEDQTKKALLLGMTVIQKGIEVDGETVQGYEEAKLAVLEAFADIDKNHDTQAAPEGDVRREKEDILADYEQTKLDRLAGKSQGILFGISELDETVGGLQPGELVLSVAYSGSGKTTLMTQLAWSAAVEQGKNVVFLTTETLRRQVRRKLIARHSMHPKFGLPLGLNTRDLKAGTLSEADEEHLKIIVNDFHTNPNYGSINVVQVPRGATLAYAETVLNRLNRGTKVDLVIADYLALFKASIHRGTEREELVNIIKEGKQISTTFDNGRGVPLVSPWQVRREAWEAALKVGYYNSAALSETAEATNSADLIVSLLGGEDSSNRHQDLSFQILKSRDGETAGSMQVAVDYATSFFRSKETLRGLTTPTGGSSGSAASFDSLLSTDEF